MKLYFQRNQTKDNCNNFSILRFNLSDNFQYILHFKEVLVEMEKGGQPIIIIDPKKEQTKGRDALSMNIAAAKAVFQVTR